MESTLSTLHDDLIKQRIDRIRKDKNEADNFIKIAEKVTIEAQASIEINKVLVETCVGQIEKLEKLLTPIERRCSTCSFYSTSVKCEPCVSCKAGKQNWRRA